MEALAVDLKTAGQVIGLSPHTLRKKIRRGELRYARVGRRILIPVSALEELLRRGMRPATAPPAA
jgi:excisionase family DNA binding protein